jgi:hypothetical protein
VRGAGRAVLLEAHEQRSPWVPARRRDRKATLYEILVERRTCQWWQSDLAGLAPLADQMEPMIAVFIGADVAQRRANEFART